MTLWKELSERGANYVLHELEDLVGATAGRLLSQLLYWHTPDKAGNSRMHARQDEAMWVARTKAQWQEDINLSEWKFRAALDRLVGLGLVIKGDYHYKRVRTLHLRLDISRLTDMVAEKDIQQELQEALSENLTMYHEETSPLSIKTKDSKKDLKQAEPPAIQTHPQPPLEQTGETDVATLTEILQKPKTVKATPVIVTSSYLCLLWKKRMGDIVEGFVKDPTGKDRGQMAMYLKKVGPQAAIEGLEYAFQHWVRFTWAAREAKGFATVPAQPVIGFLLAHHDVLLQLIAKDKAEAASWVSPVVDKPSIMPVTPTEKPQEQTKLQKLVQKLKDKKA
jgi:hypothetical protein